MTTTTLTARAATTIHAPIDRVWDALIDPAAIKQYMFGTNVTSDFKEGSPIAWKGEWQGKKYEDKGAILKIKPEQMLRYTHFGEAGRSDARHADPGQQSERRGEAAFGEELGNDAREPQEAA